MAEVLISERLRALCNMVTPGKAVVDVGCDHGFVSIYLVQKGISPKVLAMDVRQGPLSRAREHIALYGLEEYIDTRLSDGLFAYREGEARSLVCAGMGGRLMMKILSDSRSKANALEELILQPQSELPVFRRFLREEGYGLLDEKILCEEGKYYFLMKVCYVGKENLERGNQEHVMEQELSDRFGELLLERRDPVLKQYLEYSLDNLRKISETLAHNEKERARERFEELRLEMAAVEKALSLF